jgi:hypothetical protein
MIRPAIPDDAPIAIPLLLEAIGPIGFGSEGTKKIAGYEYSRMVCRLN